MIGELKRWFWKSRRVIDAEFLLLLFIAILLVLSWNLGGFQPSLQGIANLQLATFWLAMFVWIPIQVFLSLLNDFKKNRWPQIVLSRMGPWQFIFGRIFGAGLSGWVLALVSLFVFVAWSAVSASANEMAWRLFSLLAFLVGGVLCQAISIFLALASRRFRGGGHPFIFSVFIVLFASFLPLALSKLYQEDLNRWWFVDVQTVDLVVIGLLLTVFCVGHLLHWMTRRSLGLTAFQFEIVPSIWAFSLFWLGVLRGIADNHNRFGTFFTIVFIFCLQNFVLVYCTGLFFGFSIKNTRRLIWLWHQGMFRGILRECPLWIWFYISIPSSLALLFLFTGYYSLVNGSLPHQAYQWLSDLLHFSLIVTRDILIVFFLSHRFRREQAGRLNAQFVLCIVWTLGLGMSAVYHPLGALFLPISSLAITSSQIGLCVLFGYLSWREVKRIHVNMGIGQ